MWGGKGADGVLGADIAFSALEIIKHRRSIFSKSDQIRGGNRGYNRYGLLRNGVDSNRFIASTQSKRGHTQTRN